MLTKMSVTHETMFTRTDERKKKVSVPFERLMNRQLYCIVLHFPALCFVLHSSHSHPRHYSVSSLAARLEDFKSLKLFTECLLALF